MHEPAKGPLRPQPWRGSLSFGDGWAVWQGAIGDSMLHRHLAAQAVLSTEPVYARQEDGQVCSGPTILLDPLVPHKLDAPCHVEILFVEPAYAVNLPAGLKRRIAGRSDEAVWIEAPPPQRFWRRFITDGFDAVAPQRPEAIVRSLVLLDGWLAVGRAPLHRAAASVGLSPDRYRHLFTATIGIPYRRYLLWRRLQLAFQTLEAGGNVTSAAHDAGFADSAHFARTLRAMFGISATQLAQTANT